MTLYDTSVLVPVLIAEHPYKQRCQARIAGTSPKNAAIGARTVAEIYSVLTRMPTQARILPEQAIEMLKIVRTRMRVIELTAEEEWAAISRMAALGIGGGRIYDGLLVECARKIQAAEICTLNAKDFRAVAPDLAGRIVEP